MGRSEEQGCGEKIVYPTSSSRQKRKKNPFSYGTEENESSGSPSDESGGVRIHKTNGCFKVIRPQRKKMPTETYIYIYIIIQNDQGHAQEITKTREGRSEIRAFNSTFQIGYQTSKVVGAAITVYALFQGTKTIQGYYSMISIKRMSIDRSINRCIQRVCVAPHTT